MKTITFRSLGGGSSIGANCYAVGFGDDYILLDCGVHPKKEGKESLPDFSSLERHPLGVIISHGHVDHCGALPCLFQRFPSLSCFGTVPTLSIMDRMLHNSVSVMETLLQEQGIWDYPLYSHRDVDKVFRKTFGIGFQREFTPIPRKPFHVTFFSSGHVLGSASILLRIEKHNLLYTGDVCFTSQELMAGISPVASNLSVDTLVIESTRAANEEARTDIFQIEVERFARESTKVLQQGGCILVPAFALGRSQEILNVISRLIRSGKVPPVPVYTSGLSRAIYEIYSRYSQYLRPKADLRPLFEFPRIGDAWDPHVRRDLLKRPCFIVATSGMMLENTPSALIAKDMVGNDKHAIFFVGYLDPDTLGYKVLHAKTGEAYAFELGGEPVTIQSNNRQSFDLSAHAHRDELIDFIYRLQPKNVVFVHGDPEAVDWMYASCDGDFIKHRLEKDETITLEA